MSRRLAVTALSFFVAWQLIPSRVGAQSAPAPSREELAARVRQLEMQLEAMRAQLNDLRRALAEPADSAAPQEGHGAPPELLASSPRRVAQPPARESHQPGFSSGPWRVVPYGTVYFDAFGNSGGANNADIPLFAAAGAGNVSASLRQTRLGVRVHGPELLGAKLSGVFEADFFGGFPGIGVGENFGLVRLRLANARLDWKRASLEVGQDWMVFAPGHPVSIVSVAIPDLVGAGNLWSRLPQIRVEARAGSRVKWLLQAAALAPSAGDFPPGSEFTFLFQPGSGDRARLPFLQARLAVTREDWFGFAKPATLGVSVHYGRARVGTGAGTELDSFGAALDWNLPLAPHLGLLGKAFFGRNLAGFQAGILQGVNPDFAVRAGSELLSAGPRGVGTRGGWVQLGFTPPGAERLTFYGGYGLDDPRDSDLVSATPRDWRLRNQGFLFSFIDRPLPQLSWGVEFRRLETRYLESGRRTNNHVNLGLTLSF